MAPSENSQSATQGAGTALCGALVEMADHVKTGSRLSAKFPDLPIFLITSSHLVLHQNVLGFLEKAAANWSLRLPIPSDLPSLTRLNAFNALVRNAFILGIPVEALETDDYNSLFKFHGPTLPEGIQPLPTHLQPTALQQRAVHHFWLDLFPILGLRDNILRGIDACYFDEDRLCDELCCDLLNLDADSPAALLIWGDSWDANGWEFSADFFKKWGVLLLQGCPDVLSRTNYWRQKRGEMEIEFVLD